MDFIAIDFETATSKRHSPCEIGLTFVENDEIMDTKTWLIRPPSYPYFNEYNIRIHRITPDDVKDAPIFADLWDDLSHLLAGRFLVAHNASFDLSVLRRTLEHYTIPFPDLTYGCTLAFAKKVWSGLPDYGLEALCKHHHIPLKPHRAGPDSKATAELALKIFSHSDVKSVDEITEKIQVNLGKCFEGGYVPCENVQIKSPRTGHYEQVSAKDVVGDSSGQNPESPFFGKSVVFTGTLSSMTRKDAFQVVAGLGGIPSNGVTKTTDFLVVGQQDYRVGQDGMSRKQRKAIESVKKGGHIEILSEDDFIKNL
jgi:DNA polymerase III, epsilon subunit and related 3''-5'' exonucleases